MLNYTILSCISTAVLITVEKNNIKGSIWDAIDITQTSYNYDDYTRDNEWKWVMLFPFSLLIFFSLVSYYVGFKSLSEPGIGQNVRNSVVTRQMWFMLILVVTNMPSICWDIIYFFSDPDSKLRKSMDKYSWMQLYIFQLI